MPLSAPRYVLSWPSFRRRADPDTCPVDSFLRPSRESDMPSIYRILRMYRTVLNMYRCESLILNSLKCFACFLLLWHGRCYAEFEQQVLPSGLKLKVAARRYRPSHDLTCTTTSDSARRSLMLVAPDPHSTRSDVAVACDAHRPLCNVQFGNRLNEHASNASIGTTGQGFRLPSRERPPRPRDHLQVLQRCSNTFIRLSQLHQAKRLRITTVLRARRSQSRPPSAPNPNRNAVSLVQPLAGVRTSLPHTATTSPRTHG